MRRLTIQWKLAAPLMGRAVAFALWLPLAAGPAAGQGVGQGVGAMALGPKDGAGMTPLDTGRVAPGTTAPDFTLEAKDGGTVTLSQFRSRKNVILVFYRGHW